jgi:hypothetical protein
MPGRSAEPTIMYPRPQISESRNVSGASASRSLTCQCSWSSESTSVAPGSRKPSTTARGISGSMHTRGQSTTVRTFANCCGTDTPGSPAAASPRSRRSAPACARQHRQLRRQPRAQPLLVVRQPRDRRGRQGRADLRGEQGDAGCGHGAPLRSLRKLAVRSRTAGEQRPTRCTRRGGDGARHQSRAITRGRFGGRFIVATVSAWPCSASVTATSGVMSVVASFRFHAH